MRNSKIQNLALSAMLLALGLILPFLTGQIPQIGNMMLPMHLPVLFCGLLCGWKYGLLIGLILPILRSSIFSMPIMYPTAISMAFELATYGFVIGYLYEHAKWKCVASLYRCLICAMISGRCGWAIVQMILLGMNGHVFTFEMFVAGAFLNAIPGIIFQLIFIPVVMIALDKSGSVQFTKKKKAVKYL